MEKNIHKYAFKEGLPQEFEIIDFDFLFTNFLEDMKRPHRADFYQIFWFKKGNPQHQVDFNTLDIKENDLLFINKGSVQLFDIRQKFEGKALLFTADFFCKTEEDAHFLNSSILFNDLLAITKVNIDNSEVLRLFQQIEQELNSEVDEYQSEILRTYLQSLLLQAERLRKQQGFVELKRDADLQYVLQFKEHLEENFHSEKKVSYYAQAINITPKRLNKAVQSIYDKTPKNIIDERVLLEIKRLLIHSSLSVNEIAYQLGFDEVTNFVKYFKNLSNITPLNFRKKYSRD